MNTNPSEPTMPSTNQQPVPWIVWGIIYGGAMGVILGTVFNQTALGIPMGAGVGLCLGIILAPAFATESSPERNTPPSENSSA